MNYRDVLIEDLNKSIIIVSQREIYKFVTLNANYTQEDIVQDETQTGVIRVYNMYTSQVETVAIAEIVTYIHLCFEDPIENDRLILEVLDWIRLKIVTKLNDHKNKFNESELYRLIARRNVIRIENINSPNYIFEFLYKCDFILDIDDVLLNEVAEHKRQHVHSACKKLIQLKIDEIVDELTTLKSQTECEEDLKDIDTIIQMYHDVVDEVNFSDCKTLVEYFKNWPPLLLPLPEYIDKFLHKIQTTQVDDSYVDFMRIVDDMLTLNDIEELLNELETLQPSDSDIVNCKDLSPFKNYLKYKLDNGHK